MKAQLADLMFTLNAFEARLMSASRYKGDESAMNDLEPIDPQVKGD